MLVGCCCFWCLLVVHLVCCLLLDSCFFCSEQEELGELDNGQRTTDMRDVESRYYDFILLMAEIRVKHYMGVSKNRGTPKSSILIGFSLINHPFWGTPIFGNIRWLNSAG